MNLVNRGMRNAFRNSTRLASVVIILGLSITLALSMLLAHQAVNRKIDNIKSSEGNTITISPAGFRGFSGGGNPLTQTQLDKVGNINHVQTVEESLSDRLSSSSTNLQSAISLGSLGQRFFLRNGGNFGSNNSSGSAPSNFTPPITVIGSNNPTDLNSTQGGGTFSLKSGSVFSSTSTDNVALVGSSLAIKNNLSVGSSFTAYGAQVKVIGIFDSGNSFSNNLLIVPLASLQKLSGQPGDITNAVVTVDSISNVDAVTNSVKNQLGSAADVTSSKSQAESSISSLDNIKSISLYSLIGAATAGAVIIFLVMLMIVRERKREIGVLKAIGASNLRVAGQFTVEAVTLTILAAIIGILISVVVANPITHTLVNNSANQSSNVQTPGFGASRGLGGGGFMRPMSGSGDGSRLVIGPGRGLGRLRNNIANINAVIGWSVVGYGLAAALVIAIVGSLIASLSISKIRPAEVLRTE